MPRLVRSTPVLFVLDVEAAGAYYRDQLGFTIDFLHGTPPFYGAVSRDQSVLHLKFVHQPVLHPDPEEDGLISAFLVVEDVQALYDEYAAAGVIFAQTLTVQPWGWRDFIVGDPDGNGICFAEQVLQPQS